MFFSALIRRIWFVVIVLSLVACGTNAPQGTLIITANGEDFVRNGFTSKDGWQIAFDHVYVNLADVNVYQTDPPFSPDQGQAVHADQTVQLTQNHLVDLALGDENAAPITVTQADAPVGRYNALSWQMPPADDGYSLSLVGVAAKDGQAIPFTIQSNQTYEYTCGDYVGDVRKGIVNAGQSGEVEMTFHFDHLFGDAGLPADDALNIDALGFEPFAQLAQDGTVTVDTAVLQAAWPAQQYQNFLEILEHLGHTGEGHCE